MGVIIFAVAGIAIVLGLASTASASRGSETRTITPPSSLTPEGSLPPLIAAAIDAIRKGTATLEMLSEAMIEANNLGMYSVARQFSSEIDRMVKVTIPDLIKNADRPALPIPTDPETGKTFWFEKDGSMRPRYRSILIQFQSLQDTVGADPDGRIGPKTLAAFAKSAEAAGFTKYPKTIGDLAANAVKWTEILKNGYQPSQVGGPWTEFLNRSAKGYEELEPKVRAKLGSWVGKEVLGQTITMSGLLGIVSRAGMNGAKSWLKNEDDRQKFPSTTQAFIDTNGLF